jgi:CrcB protein
MAGSEADFQASGGDLDTMSIDLPLDSDIEVSDATRAAPRPVHLHWRYIVLVALGGAVGTGGREFLSTAFPATGQFPATTLVINIVGAFLLGALLEALVRRGEDHGGHRVIRLLIGTGVMGGFTTYSTLATDTALLLHNGATGLAVAYSVGTVVIGALAAALGILIATAVHRRRFPTSAGDDR